jgi:hypothetical protein
MRMLGPLKKKRGFFSKKVLYRLKTILYNRIQAKGTSTERGTQWQPR